VSGDVHIFTDASEMAIIGDLTGLEPNVNAATDCTAKNGCGVHVHSGTACTDSTTQGGHFFPKGGSWVTDPWASVIYKSTNATGHSAFSLPQLSTGAYDIGGKAFVVHNKHGSRVACGVLVEVTDGVVSTVTSSLKPGGPLARVTMYTSGSEVIFAGSASGLEPDLTDGANCTATNGCGIHVHRGTACTDSASQKGHYYDSSALSVDPWLLVKYAPSSTAGAAAFIFRTDVGYASAGVDGRAFVVHNNAGARTACGLLGRGLAPGKAGANHNFTIPHLDSMHARWFPCSARTNPTLGKKPKAASMATGIPVGRTRLGLPDFDPQFLSAAAGGSLDFAIAELSDDEPSSSHKAKGPTEPLPSWMDCAKYDCPEEKNIDSQCAMVELPTCYEPVPEANADECLLGAERLPVFVKCFRGKGKDDRKALWMMQGGPGGSAEIFEYLMFTLKANLGDSWDVCYMDHRGTGRSSFLGCPSIQAEQPGSPDGPAIGSEEVGQCAESMRWNLHNSTFAYSTTSAAMDLVSVFQRLNVDLGIKPYLYGVSYGELLIIYVYP
jgi:hypothetical protein